MISEDKNKDMTEEVMSKMNKQKLKRMSRLELETHNYYQYLQIDDELL